MIELGAALPEKIIPAFDLAISELARNSEQLLSNGLKNPNSLTFALVFCAGLLTSLGPCSLSLIPVTLAYLAGFEGKQSPFNRSIAFCSGIVLALVLLGTLSGLVGNIYGQVPLVIPTFAALLAVVMGLNLLGLVPLTLPSAPNLGFLIDKIPSQIAPLATGLTFGLAASPCTTPVLAVLLGWIAKSGNPLSGMFLLACFGFGQVMPLLIAGTAAANINSLLSIRPITRWVPPISGSILLTTGLLTLIAQWI